MPDPMQKINVRLPASVYDILANAAKVVGVSTGKLAATLIGTNLEAYTQTLEFQEALAAHVNGVKRLVRAMEPHHPETGQAPDPVPIEESVDHMLEMAYQDAYGYTNTTSDDGVAADADGDDDDTRSNDPMASLLS